MCFTRFFLNNTELENVGSFFFQQNSFHALLNNVTLNKTIQHYGSLYNRA